MLNTPLPRLSTDSIGGLSSPTGELEPHASTAPKTSCSAGANACSDRKVMQLAGTLSARRLKALSRRSNQVRRRLVWRSSDGLFRSACASVPEQFAGIVSPEITSRYEIVLQHWRLGEARFVFSCTQPRKISNRMEFFRRRCSVSGTFTPLSPDLRERAFRRLVLLRGVLKDRTADFFCRGRRFFVEVSWPIDAKGKPKTGDRQISLPDRLSSKFTWKRARDTAHTSTPQLPRTRNAMHQRGMKPRTTTCVRRASPCLSTRWRSMQYPGGVRTG